MIGLNNAFETELYYEYLNDPESVSPEWREYFSKVNGKSVSVIDSDGKEVKPKLYHAEPTNLNKEIQQKSGVKKETEFKLKEGEVLEQLSPISAKLAVNMEESISVPTATSTRIIPVKVLDENRRIINKYLQKVRKKRVSFTHILLWAVVRALKRFPHMNDTYISKEGKSYRIQRKSVNVGLAVDITKKEGSRLLLVPNVKNAQDLNFYEFMNAFNDIIARSRNNKLTLDDLANTTVTLTNPGMIGTTASSPRLMKGQGMILATGAIEYPTEFQAVRPDLLTNMAISKVVTITNTYDHRIIQGAESAEFLSYINKLLIGEKHFYDQIFVSLKIPFEPMRWQTDRTSEKNRNLSHTFDNAEKGAHVMQMINAYRVRGHLLASVNPLGLSSYYYPELDPDYYGFTIWDLDRVFHCDDAWENNNLPLREIIEILRETYCGHIGVEFMHIQTPNKKEWIKRTLESTRNSKKYSKNDKIRTFHKLVEAESLEKFLHTKYVGHKRFSLEGSESLIVLIDKIFEQSAVNDLDSIVIGMAHRGRLNVFVNNLGVNFADIISEFDDELDTQTYFGSGDVKYHLGVKSTYKLKNKEVEVILAPNPSHLELVNPVIEGMARAIGDIKQKSTRSYVLPLLIHGDAAFAGQGIVAETLNLSQLQGYKTGGTIHIIVNNQIGFTTSDTEARSTVYATDIAKMIQIPILHVNGDDPQAVQTAAAFAFDYRQRFASDVIIDLIGYRKYGHNEADEPTYTQPLLYKKIKSMVPVRNKYEKELLEEKILSDEETEKIKNDRKKSLDDIFSNKNNIKSKPKNDNISEFDSFNHYDTTVSGERLKIILDTITNVPSGFNAHPKVLSILNKRAEMINSETSAIDWATSEALAFGSILLDGKKIRFSGEDSRRGTFSQRHATITDMQTEDDIILLNQLKDIKKKITIYDSPLSELAVLGFEYGYSVISEKSMTIWEAQFGDFFNMAQPIIDQFISCAEKKWNQYSNLVILLPHSYDGQGPEHSSARLERHLQLCAENNMFVCNLTTPAQYFHVLRRQSMLEVNKPLILMTPKSILRNPLAVSHTDEFSDNGFMTIIDDELKDKKNVSRLLLCSGKIYYDLLEYKQKNNIDDIAIIRIEQLYPFDDKKMKTVLKSYSQVKDIRWVQEEPENNGAWQHLHPDLLLLLKRGQKLTYNGRKDSAATATGSYRKHVQEQDKLINDAFG